MSFSSSWPNTELGLPDLDRATVAGISVAIAGNILISLALNFQKLAHRRLEREREDRKAAVADSDSHGQVKDGAVHSPSQDDTPTPSVGVLETDPLLPVSNPSPGYSSDILDKNRQQARGKWNILSRLRRDRAVNTAQKADRDHLTATHAMMPVEIVAIPSTSSTDSNADGESHNGRQDRNENESDYLKSKLWWLGFLLMNVGEVGNFISYAFAPASVVAPLGTFALIANCLFAPFMLGERFRKRDLFGILLAIIGAVTVVLSANPSDVRLGPSGLLEAISQHVFIAFATVYIVIAIILSGLSERSFGKRWVYVDVGLCAIFGGFTVLSTKAISTLLTMEWFDIFTEWITYPIIAVLAGTGVGQIRYLNRALMRFDSKIVVPTQFVFFNLSAIIGSAILYGDFKRATFHQVVTFLYGCGATFAGVFIITWTSRTPPADEIDSNDTEDQEDIVNHLEEGARLPRNVRMGSLARRNRATLVIPEGIVSAAATPILRRRQSLVSMIGLSPAQRLLIINSSPQDEVPHPLPYDGERDVLSTPGSLSRRRAVSWFGDDTAARSASRRLRLHSDVGTRESGRIRGVEE